jgi:ABC-type multidrug transport system fused ATPase/permease subunit
MSEAFVNLGWAMLFSIVGGAVGIVLIMAATLVIPRFLEKLTPNMDEDKEIARGNRAVAEYFGRIVAASIIGVSIVIAAAVLGGIIVALY